jgi:hypothetical protein
MLYNTPLLRRKSFPFSSRGDRPAGILDFEVELPYNGGL